MRAVGSSDTALQSSEATNCHVPEDSIIHGHCNETFQAHIIFAPLNIECWTSNYLLLLYTTRLFSAHNFAWNQVWCLVKWKAIYCGKHKYFGEISVYIHRAPHIPLQLMSQFTICLYFDRHKMYNPLKYNNINLSIQLWTVYYNTHCASIHKV